MGLNLGIILGMETFNLGIILVMNTFNLGIILVIENFNITGLILLYTDEAETRHNTCHGYL